MRPRDLRNADDFKTVQSVSLEKDVVLCTLFFTFSLSLSLFGFSIEIVVFILICSRQNKTIQVLKRAAGGWGGNKKQNRKLLIFWIKKLWSVILCRTICMYPKKKINMLFLFRPRKYYAHWFLNNNCCYLL